MERALLPVSMLSLLSIGAIFGFFYAWVCSTMWGLDAAAPEVAIAAMQAMNASVRNAVFFPAFFLTPVFLALAGIVSLRCGRGKSAMLFAAAAVLYTLGALVVTATVNVPMNEALAMVAIPADTDEAAAIWTAYSSEWQVWNMRRTIVSGVALILTGFAVFFLNERSR